MSFGISVISGKSGISGISENREYQEFKIAIITLILRAFSKKKTHQNYDIFSEKVRSKSGSNSCSMRINLHFQFYPNKNTLPAWLCPDIVNNL